MKRLPLRMGQTGMMIVFGAVLWLAAALLLRKIGPMGVFDGVARIILYAAVVPATWPFVLLAQRLAQLAEDQVAVAVAVAVAAATLLDGVALAWFPALYGDAPEQIAAAGAVILWGAGVALVIGMVENRVVRMPGG